MNLKPKKNKPFQYNEIIVNVRENTSSIKEDLNPDDYLYLDGDSENENENGKYNWQEDEEDRFSKYGCLCRYCKFCDKRERNED